MRGAFEETPMAQSLRGSFRQHKALAGQPVEAAPKRPFLLPPQGLVRAGTKSCFLACATSFKLRGGLVLSELSSGASADRRKRSRFLVRHLSRRRLSRLNVRRQASWL